MEKDPVCGMLVEPGEAAGKREFAAHTWYFCSADCLKKFDQAPQRYVPPAPEAGAQRPHD
ncbi:MAG TPA: YHS domain-containing protein [Burkholderiales bacterium]|nr:YHS domain-containing protein [Burkholderiales bacterium]